MSSSRTTLWIYGLTLLVSASLLFAVQPMVAKMIQPVLGGSPAVWNTSMVFFQGLLLFGYLYAHLSVKWLGVRRQALLHVALLVVGFLFLPLTFGAPTDLDLLSDPTAWLLLTLLIAVGWPFFMISTSAPLLQKWFSTLDHPDAPDPYLLYSASNLGSILALVAYPFVIEPRLGLTLQTHLWTAGYLLLFGAVAACASFLWRSPSQGPRQTPLGPPRRGHPLTWARRRRWIGWAFIPTAMMLAITTFITTDVAPVPLLWMPPLALYLASFILAFGRRKLLPPSVMNRLFPATLIGLLALPFLAELPLWAATLAYLSALFFFSMTFHGLLAEDRPETDHLTEFYLWISLGGVLGGVFTALVAPALFPGLLEVPALLILSCFLFSRQAFQDRLTRWLTGVAATIAAIALGVAHFFDATTIAISTPTTIALTVITLTAALAILRFTPARFSFLLAGLAAASFLVILRPSPQVLVQERSFFGVHRVEVDPSGTFHILYHGTTRHGAQSLQPELRHLPLAYYYPTGPADEIFSVINRRSSVHPTAVIGLGTGSIAAYASPSRIMHFFEIDPVVKEIASDPELFTFLADCGESCQVTLGDGRLQLAASHESFELIVLDAYTSSAIPVHLLTREAFELYLDHLTTGGLIAVHISNRYLDLQPPLTALAQDLGLTVRHRVDRVRNDHPYFDLQANSSSWLLLSRTPEDMRELAIDPQWQTPTVDLDVRVWTDDFADLLSTYF